MKITINDVIEHDTIAAAIEAKASDSDSIASGNTGPSFSTSGPGPGWSRTYDVSDYARRALEEDCCSYIDSADGREATMEEGEVVWSDESIVEIVTPSLSEALESPEAYRVMADTAVHYGADADEWETLADKVATPYEISDGNASEPASTLAEAAEIAADWYDFLRDEGKIDEVPTPELDDSDLDLLNASIGKWEAEIAEAMGVESFAGHGNYHVSAADRAGLSLTVSLRE